MSSIGVAGEVVPDQAVASLVGRTADRGMVAAALDRLEAAAAGFDALNLDALSETDVLAVAGRLEAVTRSHAVTDHRVMDRLARVAPRDYGAKSVVEIVATRLRVSRRAARVRLREAALLSPRLPLTGTALPPKLSATATGVAEGVIGAEHVTIIAEFLDRLPQRVEPEVREEVEAELAGYAGESTPEDLRALALRLAAMIDTDGPLADEDRARRRGIVLGPQGCDGMSKLSGWVTPAWRAAFEVIVAKLGAPGMCDPAQPAPCIDGTPTSEQIGADTRTVAQRTHDALLAAARAVLACGELGKLNGLPATIVITATLQDLTDAVGVGMTPGGTIMPMSEVIRHARHAWHYLSVFDKHTNVPLYLGRSRRTASPGQRIVLYARDLGCTFPTCTTPGYRCEIHHCDPWRETGQTNIDEIAQACPGNHRMTEGDPATRWTVRMNKNGLAEWIPPPKLDTGGPRVNNYHHPGRLLTRHRQRPKGAGTQGN